MFVDEVQTGMHRTGPFILSTHVGLTPDLLTLGKGASDMMFPFALTLYTAAVHERLNHQQSKLPAAIEQKYGYDFGYKTVLNTLHHIDTIDVPKRVAERGALFDRVLSERLRHCRSVREVRAHGLLIGIELETRRGPGRWLKKRIASLYLLRMLRRRAFPVLVGFCQYEPHVLKLTPPLSFTPQEVSQVCDTIVTVLQRPFYQLLPSLLGALVKPALRRKPRHQPSGARA